MLVSEIIQRFDEQSKSMWFSFNWRNSKYAPFVVAIKSMFATLVTWMIICETINVCCSYNTYLPAVHYIFVIEHHVLLEKNDYLYMKTDAITYTHTHTLRFHIWTTIYLFQGSRHKEKVFMIYNDIVICINYDHVFGKFPNIYSVWGKM